MTVRNRTKRVWLGVAVLALPCLVLAQQPAPGAPALTSPVSATIPMDPAIASGAFPNGLRYYVRANHMPQGRAELRLVVNAGSLMEEEDQRGLAHFVEHMAFNGTKHFAKNQVVSFMQSIGMRFGAHVNAYTSFDETVFMLQIPTDTSDVTEKAMQILEDWAARRPHRTC